MISARLLSVVRCPDCGAAFTDTGDVLACGRCGRTVPRGGGGFLDLRPRSAFAETTKYTDEALHADARHETVSPPLLGAGVRNHMLQKFLALAQEDRVVDLGCGSGRMMLWNSDAGAWLVGVDVAPFFAREAMSSTDLVLGDLRRLPFADDTFTKAWSLDVAEHLSLEALSAVLAEASRVLAPGGTCFMYSHVRKNAPIAAGLRWINRLGRALDDWGMIDTRQERLRKSDHVNPLRDIPHLEEVVGRAGFRVRRIRYYTPLVGGFVENILMRLVERALARRASRRQPAGTSAPEAGVREVRTSAKARIARGGFLYWALEIVTRVMLIDLVLFGRIRSGPFFVLLEKVGPQTDRGGTLASERGRD